MFELNKLTKFFNLVENPADAIMFHFFVVVVSESINIFR